MPKYLIPLGERRHMDLTYILRAVKDGKMDLKTAEQQTLGWVLFPTQVLQKVIPQENQDSNN